MLALNGIKVETIFENKKGIEDSQRILDELLRVVEVVLKKRDEKYLNSQFNNKLDLTIHDKDKQNIFAYAKEAECEKELLGFIASIPMKTIVSNLEFLLKIVENRI